MYLSRVEKVLKIASVLLKLAEKFIKVHLHSNGLVQLD
jgi:hypothetical protein